MADPGGMCGRAALVIQNMAYTLVFSVVSNCSSESSVSAGSVTCVPALLTRMSKPPSASTAVATRSSQKPRSMMSPGMATAVRPSASIKAMTSLASGSSAGK